MGKAIIKHDRPTFTAVMTLMETLREKRPPISSKKRLRKAFEYGKNQKEDQDRFDKINKICHGSRNSLYRICYQLLDLGYSARMVFKFKCLFEPCYEMCYFYDEEKNNKKELEELHKLDTGFKIVKGIKIQKKPDMEPGSSDRTVKIVIPKKYYRPLSEYSMDEFTRHKNKEEFNKEDLDDFETFFRVGIEYRHLQAYLNCMEKKNGNKVSVISQYYFLMPCELEYNAYSAFDVYLKDVPDDWETLIIPLRLCSGSQEWLKAGYLAHELECYRPSHCVLFVLHRETETLKLYDSNNSYYYYWVPVKETKHKKKFVKYYEPEVVIPDESRMYHEPMQKLKNYLSKSFKLNNITTEFVFVQDMAIVNADMELKKIAIRRGEDADYYLGEAKVKGKGGRKKENERKGSCGILCLDVCRHIFAGKEYNRVVECKVDEYKNKYYEVEVGAGGTAYLDKVRKHCLKELEEKMVKTQLICK